ncbi:hypothetical protein KIPB_001404, partial [Kipferlia bialata]|eukprot:g1404.t1
MPEASSTEDERVYVGLDFGTAYSGYAISQGGSGSKVEACYTWPDQVTPYCKTRTALYYQRQQGGEWVATHWGHSAHKQEARTRARDAGDGMLVTRFKLLLDGALRDDTPKAEGGSLSAGDGEILKVPKITDICKVPPQETKRESFSRVRKAQPTSAFGRLEMDVVDVVADYLRFMCLEIRRVIGGRFGDTCGVQWCLTVPAMWTPKAKSQMREAAYKAGIIDSEVCVEMGMKNHEWVPLQLITVLSAIRPGYVARVVQELLKAKLIRHTVCDGGQAGDAETDTTTLKLRSLLALLPNLSEDDASSLIQSPSIESLLPHITYAILAMQRNLSASDAAIERERELRERETSALQTQVSALTEQLDMERARQCLPYVAYTPEAHLELEALLERVRGFDCSALTTHMERVSAYLPQALRLSQVVGAINLFVRDHTPSKVVSEDCTTLYQSLLTLYSTFQTARAAVVSAPCNPTESLAFLHSAGELYSGVNTARPIPLPTNSAVSGKDQRKYVQVQGYNSTVSSLLDAAAPLLVCQQAIRTHMTRLPKRFLIPNTA